MPIFGRRSSGSEMATKVAVKRKHLADKATLPITVNDPGKSGIVNERDCGSTIDKLAQFSSPYTIQFVDARTDGVTGELLCEFAN